MRRQTLLFHIQEIYHLKEVISTMLKPVKKMLNGDLELFNAVFGTAIKVAACKVNCNKNIDKPFHSIPHHLHEDYVCFVACVLKKRQQSKAVLFLLVVGLISGPENVNNCMSNMTALPVLYL